MLSHFPAPYEGELFWSVVARYHERSLAVSLTDTLKMLHGKSDKNPQFNLERILDRVKYFEYCSLDEILNNNTTYNFHVFFINQDQSKNFLMMLINGAINFKNDKTNLRFCPHCLKEDINDKGETYWRYFHQVPSAFTCLKHNTLLQESTVEYKAKKLAAANEKNCIALPPKKISRKTYFMLQRVTIESEFIFINKAKFDHSKLQLFIGRSLESKGLIDQFGVVKKPLLFYQLIKTFGLEFFQYINFDIEKFIEVIFTTFGHSGVQSYLSCTELLILVIFLCGSVKNFLKEISEFSARARKCIVCGNSSLTSRLHMDEKTNKCTMDTKCACGVSQFSIMGDRYISYRSLKIIFKTREHELDYYYNQIFNKGLRLDKLSWKLNVNEVQIEHLLAECLAARQEDKSITRKYKKEWEALSDAVTPIEELKLLNYPAYIWLHTYAFDYLLKFNYPPLNASSINKDIWKKRDKKIKETLRDFLFSDRLSCKSGRIIITLNYRYGEGLCLKWPMEISCLPETKKFIDKLKLLRDGLLIYK
ncbi:hypothetical protein D1B31_19300 [Neobacillus notoginsengisoli]|uniref:TniQ domain-containing protein n=1 Tax=Neobacillus notoginsengisoli TaxID=1578198 RepID=A0A417YMY4_9BACI|nr:TniQ family protein [Neobacillus notoginsengisoli]RHW34815.1 hypothetical protein D1B31_19300 [Neobacillus notoginsengisoli]